MNKKLLAVFLAAAFLLCGCQLAVEDAGQNAEPDRLVGIYVTRDYIDTFDMDAYLQDNIDAISDGADIDLGDTREYYGRIYAQLVLSSFTDSEGFEHTTYSYDFPGVEGMMLCYFRFEPQEAEGIAYSGSKTDTGIIAGPIHCSYTDEGEEITMSGSIYFQRDYSGEIFLYCNPVYQTSEGEVYMLPGDGIYYSAALAGEFSQTLTENVDYTDPDGVQQNYRCDVTLTTDCVDIPEKVVLIQMDENHQELSRSEYIPGQFPDEMAPDASAAYILVEEHYSTSVSYTMHQPGSDPVSVFFPQKGGICIPDYMNILWPDSQ